MRIVLIFVLFFLSTSILSNDDLLSKYCKKYKGVIQKKYACPKSGLTIPFLFCVKKRDNLPDLFFDGCTGPTGGNAELFYSSCIEHDLCYHREPSTNGKTQKMCDDELLESLSSACNTLDNSKSCLGWAKTMYRAVRLFGKLAYNCANSAE